MWKVKMALDKFKDFFRKNNNNNDVSVFDYVTVSNYDGLTDKQLSFLKSREKFKVLGICNREGMPYVSGVKYFKVGYNIPLKASRFSKVDDDTLDSYKYKVLFISFEFKLSTYGEPDTTNMLRGCNRPSELMPMLFKEKMGDEVFVNFISYDDVYRYQNDYYVDDVKLKDYDFVFFGFMAKHTNISTLIINYLTANKVPHMKYETYDYFHNKAYQFDLLETLGYPYIPSIMTTKLTRNILKAVEEFKYPVIVKDVYLDRGEGVWKMNNSDELIDFFERNKSLCLIQKFIPNDGEWRVITVKNKVVLIARKEAVGDISKKDFDDRRSVKGYLPAEVTKMCEDVAGHLFSDIIGFDIIQDLKDKKYYIIETNASPHITMFSVVTGVSVPEKIVDYIIENIKK